MISTEFNFYQDLCEPVPVDGEDQVLRVRHGLHAGRVPVTRVREDGI